MLDLNAIEHRNDRYFFSPYFENIIDQRELNKLYIYLWYKDFFSNIGSKQATRKNHNFIAEWSYNINKDESIYAFQNFLDLYKPQSVMDLWSGKSQLIISLAIENPEINFYGLEIEKHACETAQKYINEKQLSNVQVINGDITKIRDIKIDGKIDMLISSFVLHEFIADQSIESVLKDITQTLSPKHLILREFCPPEEISSISHLNIDRFYFGYSFLHMLSDQKTYTIAQWKQYIEKHGFNYIDCKHRFPYWENESLYPIMCYKQK